MKLHRHIFVLLTLPLVFACLKEEASPWYEDPSEEITPVTLSLDLEIAQELNGTPGTKAIDDPVSVASTEIRNLCILQYKGTDENSKLIGDVHYYSKDLDPEDENYLDLSKIRLADSNGANHTLVILVNTFTRLPKVTTLGEMKRLWRSVYSPADIFGHMGDGAGFPTDVTYYQRMSAFAVTPVADDVTVRAKLRRTMARIKVEINNPGNDGLQIRYVWLRNVSQKDYYFAHYSYLDPSDGVTEHVLFSGDFQDEYDPSYPMRIDYSQEAWTGDNSNGDGTGTANYTWYITPNMRGTDYYHNTLPKEKNRCPNTDGATYLWILADYGADHDQPVLYRFYLGENLTDNFDLKPNTSYQYTFTLTGKGSVPTDDRVEDLSQIDFNVDANCYMVCPPPLGSRSYTFNVVHRPNIFWGTLGGDRYGIRASGLYPNNPIGLSETWYARIIWSDFPMTQEEANAFLCRKTGTGSGDYADDTQRVKITVPTSLKKGNVIIGIYTDNPDNILWSWHIWITEYKPDDIKGHPPVADRFVYEVAGGEVHRYNGVSWMKDSDDGLHRVPSGLYANGYAMDRNLGTWDAKYHSSTYSEQKKGGSFLYQFGRKDPFPNDIIIYKYDYDGTPTQVAAANNVSAIQYGTGELAYTDGSNVPYSISHPLVQIGGTDYWTFGDIFNPDTRKDIVWQDPYNTVRTSYEEGGGAKDKSFFDPCPPGWKIPYGGTGNYVYSWTNGFLGDKQGPNTDNPAMNMQQNVESSNGHNRGLGFTYYPNGYLADKDNPNAPTAFFPLTGYRYRTSSNTSQFGSWNNTVALWTMYNWNSDRYRGTYVSAQLGADFTNSSSGNHFYKSYAMAIRCVRVDY